MQGAGGGPIEDNVAGLLVRSTSTNWAKGSILGVDPGKHLAAIIRIIEEHLPNIVTQQNPGRTHSEYIYTSDPTFSLAEPDRSRRFLSTGPFATLELPHVSPKANGAYIIRDLISTHLISHPHLDHIAGLILNTAGFYERANPKRLAALPSALDALRDHIFNDIIWPDLSSEAGLVSYMPLADANTHEWDVNENVEYTEISKGLSVRCWSVSHGSCKKRHAHHVSSHNGVEEYDLPHSSPGSKPPVYTSKQRSREGPENSHPSNCERSAFDSSAFFLRDDQTGQEVLIFGDVEPDSLSIFPRNNRVWEDAAPKIISHLLKGIFIECSYDDSRTDETLFGHLCPRHLMTELGVLAAKVEILMPTNGARIHETQKRKRKIYERNSKLHEETPSPSPTEYSPHKSRRKNEGSEHEQLIHPSYSLPLDVGLTPEASSTHSGENAPNEAPLSPRRSKALRPLDGLQIIITHVKDTLSDGPEASDTILAELRQYETNWQLGCEFLILKPGTSIWL